MVVAITMMIIIITIMIFINTSPNVVIEWLTILLRTSENPGSNLGPETGYPD
jgi:hypothetical protein